MCLITPPLVARPRKEAANQSDVLCDAMRSGANGLTMIFLIWHYANKVFNFPDLISALQPKLKQNKTNKNVDSEYYFISSEINMYTTKHAEAFQYYIKPKRF